MTSARVQALSSMVCGMRPKGATVDTGSDRVRIGEDGPVMYCKTPKTTTKMQTETKELFMFMSVMKSWKTRVLVNEERVLLICLNVLRIYQAFFAVDFSCNVLY